MNCEQVWQEISNYLEGDVDAGLRAAMDEHFQTCPRCDFGARGDAECHPVCTAMSA